MQAWLPLRKAQAAVWEQEVQKPPEAVRADLNRPVMGRRACTETKNQGRGCIPPPLVLFTPHFQPECLV